jgi:hypothetical protein
MFSNFLKNNSVMTFYIVSIISFFIANFIRDKNLTIYFVLLFFGLLFFILGLIKRFGKF